VLLLFTISDEFALIMDNQEDLRDLSSQCVRAFDKLIETLTTCPEERHKDMSPHMVEKEFGRFKIWCGNLGALQKGRSSLDVRLRGSKVMRDTVTRFLIRLEEALKDSE
jgi:hypothetical protein